MAMSGGVDSSVAAYMLQKDPNNTLIGLFMSNWVVQDDDSVSSVSVSVGDHHQQQQQQQQRCSEADYNDAKRTCEHLHLPLHHASFAKEYWTTVFEPFVDAVASGLMTPNPDVDCNANIKFGTMKDYARQTLGAEWIATGHYARLYHHNTTTTEQQQRPPPQGVVLEDWMLDWSESPLLLAGVDKSKDQSYFLATVTGKALENVEFPVGNYYKTMRSTNSTQPTVRQLALEAKLPTALKRESMGICFVGKRNFPEFISQYLPEIPGPGVFVNVENSQVIGHHKGSWHYTIGQGAKLVALWKNGSSWTGSGIPWWYVQGRTMDRCSPIKLRYNRCIGLEVASHRHCFNMTN
jgi:tRNA-specific 2-thiouridylase